MIELKLIWMGFLFGIGVSLGTLLVEWLKWLVGFLWFCLCFEKKVHKE